MVIFRKIFPFLGGEGVEIWSQFNIAASEANLLPCGLGPIRGKAAGFSDAFVSFTNQAG